MPELPEVEAARRGITNQLLHRPITAVDLRLPKFVIGLTALTHEDMVGREIDEVRRHGKYLSLFFGDLVGVLHLKLAGQVVARGVGIPGFAAGHPVPAYDAPLPHKSTHLILTFGNAAQLYLTDIRHFARLTLLPLALWDEFMYDIGLGPDLFDPGIGAETFAARIQMRPNSRLKPLLLDQSCVAGLGNIYVDEALHVSRLHPQQRVSTLTSGDVERLYAAIMLVLNTAVPTGGANIVGTKAMSEHGTFPWVHAREGLTCTQCGGVIIKTRVDQRGTYLCPICQVAPT